MKRTKWYKYKSPDGKHVAYGTTRYLALWDGDDGDYYELKGRAHISRSERKKLNIYKFHDIMVKSGHLFPVLYADIIDEQGFVITTVLDIAMERQEDK